MLKPIDLTKTNRLLLFIILISIILYYGREFFILLTFSGFFAMLMTPVSNRLEKRISRGLATLISVLILLAVSSAVIWLLSAQVRNITKDMPQIVSGIEDLLYPIKEWVTNSLGVSPEQLRDHATGAISSAGTFLTGIVKNILTFVGRFTIVLVFTFLLMLNRDKYENFVVMLYKDERRDEAKELIRKISKIAQHYLAGRLVAVFIMGILYITGFEIIGLKDAIILSAIAALITVIPFIGTLLGGLIPLFMAIISGTIDQAIWVVIIVLLVNLVDHYFIEPYIVGGSVKISPFFTIFILILGGAVWGISGVILFLPLLGIIKIILENFESLRPYAYLIGDQRESSAHEKIFLKIRQFLSGRKKNG
jgi:predicted PurR-regulated permease PerM